MEWARVELYLAWNGPRLSYTLNGMGLYFAVYEVIASCPVCRMVLLGRVVAGIGVG